jgi:hypothetical protein
LGLDRKMGRGGKGSVRQEIAGWAKIGMNLEV